MYLGRHWLACVGVAPFAGAWIEICASCLCCVMSSSLPSRERGLKLVSTGCRLSEVAVAPFAGAWIEMSMPSISKRPILVAPFAGAWIEMATVCVRVVLDEVAPFAGAWIEMPAYGMP